MPTLEERLDRAALEAGASIGREVERAWRRLAEDLEALPEDQRRAEMARIALESDDERNLLGSGLWLAFLVALRRRVIPLLEDAVARLLIARESRAFARQWAREHGFALLRGISAETRAGLAAALARSPTLATAALTRQLDLAVGLTPWQIDKIAKRVIRDGLTARQEAALVRAWRRRRARLLAMHESRRATIAGAVESWKRQAARGADIQVGGVFSGADGGTAESPPLHYRCRCVLVQEGRLIIWRTRDPCPICAPYEGAVMGEPVVVAA